MKTFKTPSTKRPPVGKPSARRRDPMRWTVAALAALALIGIGAMETHILMLREGKDLLSAILEATAFVLIAAIPIGYVVYRYWFAEHIFMKPLKGWHAGAVDMDNGYHFSDREDFSHANDEGLIVQGFHYGTYGNFNLRDDD